VVFATGQRYYDYIYFFNDTNKKITISGKVTDNVYYVNNITMLKYGNDINDTVRIGSVIPFSYLPFVEVEPNETMPCYAFAYSTGKLHEISIYDKFKMIVGEFSIVDENGEILLTHETVKPENFKIKVEYGTTRAYLIIQ
jgi:hypothetical protein